MLYRIILLILILPALPGGIYAQSATNDRARSDTGNVLTLNDCIRYALKNHASINISLLDEQIARKDKAIAFSWWLPQVTGTANLQHYFQLPTVYSNTTGTTTTSGVYNYSLPQVTATQTLFNQDVLLGVNASKLNAERARQNTTGVKIAIVAGVSKAFYDLLLSLEQIEVYKEDTGRLKKNQSDAYNRYVSGVADKVDYKQATITLNNSLSRLKSATENVAAKYAVLTQMIGYPVEKKFTVRFDTAQMMQEIVTDTLAQLQFEKRIEYQQLQTIKRIQRETTHYYRLNFLPNLSGFYNYVHEYENNKFSDLYNKAYPYSSAGIQLSIPVFSGLRRIENIRKAEIEEQKADLDEVNLKLLIYAEYKQALANYKSNLYYLGAQGENVAMAREVYNIVRLQYSEGIKAYLDVIVAETDLQTSEINYLNALFHLLESKIDLERAMGGIPADI